METRKFTIPCLMNYDTLKNKFQKLLLQSHHKANQRITFNIDISREGTCNSSNTRRKEISRNEKDSKGRQLRSRETGVRNGKKRRGPKFIREIHEAKPGTAGSRQAMDAPKRGSRVKKTPDYESDSDDYSYAGNIVDGNLVYSANELKQKYHSHEASSDPKEWCKSFHITVPFMNLTVGVSPSSTS